MPSRHCLVQSLEHHANLPSTCHSVPPRDHNSHVADQECHRLTIILFAPLSVSNKLAITSQFNIKVASSNTQPFQNYHVSFLHQKVQGGQVFSMLQREAACGLASRPVTDVKMICVRHDRGRSYQLIEASHHVTE